MNVKKGDFNKSFRSTSVYSEMHWKGCIYTMTVMLVTLWWRLISDVGGRIIMLATFFVMLVIFWIYEISHEHPESVNNTFGLQHPSPTSMWPFYTYNIAKAGSKSRYRFVFWKENYYSGRKWQNIGKAPVPGSVIIIMMFEYKYRPCFVLMFFFLLFRSFQSQFYKSW